MHLLAGERDACFHLLQKKPLTSSVFLGRALEPCISGRFRPCRGTCTPTPPTTPMRSSEYRSLLVPFRILGTAPDNHPIPTPSPPFHPFIPLPIYVPDVLLPGHCPATSGNKSRSTTWGQLGVKKDIEALKTSHLVVPPRITSPVCASPNTRALGPGSRGPILVLRAPRPLPTERCPPPPPLHCPVR